MFLYAGADLAGTSRIQYAPNVRVIRVMCTGRVDPTFVIKAFDDIVLNNKEYVDIITGGAFTHRTYYMGLVDENNKVDFYDGMIRVVFRRAS